MIALHDGHSQKNWQAFVGICSVDWWLHLGQVSVDSNWIVLLFDSISL